MILSAVAAVGPRGELGVRGGMPWPSLKKDMERFVELTKGSPVIMGRGTWLSLPDRFRPLRGRANFILSRDRSWYYDLEVPDDVDTSVDVCRDVGEVDAWLKMWGGREAFVIGGAEIYRLFYPRLDRFYVTRVSPHHGPDFEADKFLAPYPLPADEWSLAGCSQPYSAARGSIVYTMCTYDRTRKVEGREHAAWSPPVTHWKAAFGVVSTTVEVAYSRACCGLDVDMAGLVATVRDLRKVIEESEGT